MKVNPIQLAMAKRSAPNSPKCSCNVPSYTNLLGRSSKLFCHELIFQSYQINRLVGFELSSFCANTSIISSEIVIKDLDNTQKDT